MKQTFLKTFFLSALAVLASVPAYALDGYSMQIADFEIKAGETKKVEISMDNATEISALSLEMRLPQGFTVGTDKRGNPAVTQTERVYANYFAISDFEVMQGEESVLPIELVNADEISAVQLQVVLPEGISVKADKRGNPMVKHDADRWYDQQLKANLVGQTLKIATLSNEAYNGNSGTLLNATLTIDENMVSGIYTIKIINAKLSTPAGVLIECPDAECSVTVGDVSDVGITQRIETKVFGLEGLIAVCNAEGKTADIYTPDGRLVASHLCSSSADRLSVQKGAYLVKVLGNTTKVIVY